MKHILIIFLAAIAFAACTTKETTKETVIETVKEPAPAAVPAPEKKNKFEMELSDTGSSIKIKLP
jgi:hypothetical protein